MSKLFQIHEEDLAELERLCPAMAQAMWPVWNNALRIKARKVQEILSSVRWNYGPPAQVESLPGGDGCGPNEVVDG